MPRNKILVVDDEEGVRFGMRDFLECKGYAVEEADDFERAQEVFRVDPPDVAVVDYLMPNGNALDLLPRLKEIDSTVPVIILTGHGSIELAVRAVKEGAENFLTKPVELEALHVILQRLVENRRNRQKQLAGRSRHCRLEKNPFLGSSDAIRRLEEHATRVMHTDRPVLIRGETGTGKGVLAEWLHEHSPRADEAFVDLNCAGLARELLETELFGHEKGAFTGASAAKTGLLEVAHRGTIFLDEIGDVDIHVQPKLLKALEEKRFRRLGDVRDRSVDIRLIAATHQDLRQLMSQKKFRSDLYYRISTIPLFIPPLRQRVEDIPVLAERLLEALATDLGRADLTLSQETVRALQSYSWPGNIRELRNVLERAILLSENKVIQPKNLAFDVSSAVLVPADGSNLTLRELERQHIEKTLREERGRVAGAAQRLGIPKSSLYQKLKNYGILLPKSRSPV